MNIQEIHIRNIITQNKFNNFEISELNFEARTTPGAAPSSHLLLSTDLGNGICFGLHSLLYWFNIGTSMDSTDWSSLHIPQLQLTADKTNIRAKAGKFSWNWLGPICTPIEYDMLCNAKGQLELNHYNPDNPDDTAFFLSFHKLYILNPK